MDTNDAIIKLLEESAKLIADAAGEEKPPRRKVIYVDDVSFNLITMKNRLKPYYEVFPSKSADALFQTLESVEPDVILLDVNMPDTNGFDILKGLKAVPRFSDIPVIFLTASKDRETVAKGMDLGAADIIFKPATDTEIVDRVELLFDEARRQKNRPVVLAVDDDPSILRSINLILHDEYAVYTLPKPEAINETLKLVKPDLFLLDLHMPAMNGDEVARVIREKQEFEDTPIVFLTSDATCDGLFSTIAAGASDYVIKPIDENILKTKLETHLKGFMKRRLVRSLL